MHLGPFKHRKKLLKLFMGCLNYYKA
jgi:hypothetical protein